MPTGLNHVRDSWINTHPGWGVRVWGNDDIPRLECQALLKHYSKPMMWKYVADIMRVLILKKYGGVYVDVDIFCFRNIDWLRHEASIVLVQGVRQHYLHNGFIMASPDSTTLNDMYTFTHRCDRAVRTGFHTPDQVPNAESWHMVPHNYADALILPAYSLVRAKQVPRPDGYAPIARHNPRLLPDDVYG